MSARDLLDSLHREIEIAGEIARALAEQNKALRELDLAGLEASVPTLEELGRRLHEAEARRAEAAEEMVLREGLPADAPLGEFLSRYSGPEGAELRAARQRLVALIDEIYHSNHANYVLMVNAARFNRAILQYIAGSVTTYAPDGAAGEGGGGGAVLVDKKA